MGDGYKPQTCVLRSVDVCRIASLKPELNSSLEHRVPEALSVDACTYFQDQLQLLRAYPEANRKA